MCCRREYNMLTNRAKKKKTEPRPTQNGEIWVFNKNFTQYIPLSLYDLQLSMEFPSIYVWDCSSAETIVNWFMRFAKDHEDDWHKKLLTHQETVASTSISGARINSHMTADQQAESLKFQRRPKFRECIHLAACREDERLPTNADLPADLFTSCLTTPIHTSILWYLIKSGRKNQFPPKLLDEIPGQLNDRRTILGELNWVFTAITDTIAWNALPRDDFQRLFRQDLLLASLFRSFLLAERVMTANGCNVVSSPSLPSTADHPLWDSWDYTLDLTLNHIYNLLTPKLNFQVIGRDLLSKSSVCSLNTLVDLSGINGDGQDVQHNWFFIEQLNAFEVVTMNDPTDRNSLSSSISQVMSVVSTYSGPSESDVSFRERANKQLAYLESKNFKEPLERTWVALLKLTLDPEEKVARMAQKLVRRVEMVAADIQNNATALNEKIESVSSFAHIAKVDSAHTSIDTLCGTTEVDHSPKVEKLDDTERGGVRFMIGSPVAVTNASLLSPEATKTGLSPGEPDIMQTSNGGFNHPAVAKLQTSSQSRTSLPTHQRKLSMPSHFPATPRGSDARSSQFIDLMKQSFTPKRGTTARGEFSKGIPAAGSAEPMLTSEFVPWCSRIFVQPILDLIYCKEEVDDFTDRALTLVNPTDWAIFVEQGQRQQADSEFEHFRTVHCDSHLMTARVPNAPTSVSFSMLRKCIYSTDGDQIYITRYEKSHNNLARKFSCSGDNPFNTDKTSSIIVINEMSREMLLCGSSAGIVRTWDPSFNIHSHEIEGLPQFVTASNPLCDQSRPVEESQLTLYE